MKNQNNTALALVTIEKPVFKFKKAKDEIDEAIQAFLNGATEGKFGRYYIHDDLLVYKIAVTEELRTNNTETLADFEQSVKSGKFELINCQYTEIRQKQYVKYRSCQANIICQRVNYYTYIGNSAALSLLGRKVAFGNVTENRNETEVQKRLSQFVPMIPFNVFKEAGLDLAKFKLIDKGEPETLTRKISTGKHDKKNKEIFKDETLHFTGASLFEVDGSQFLFDIDRREIKHKIFNAFLVKLPAHVKTIERAYSSLKPLEVTRAEQNGIEVLRQGEWFFIKVKGEYQHDMAKDWQGKAVPKIMELKAGDNRPNHAEYSYESDDLKLVTGKITHSGREHEPLKLKGWFKPVPNTATESFTITGNID